MGRLTAKDTLQYYASSLAKLARAVQWMDVAKVATLRVRSMCNWTEREVGAEVEVMYNELMGSGTR
jgi:hypothetical protein